MKWQSKKLIDISHVSTGKWDANHATEAGNYKFFTCAYDSFLCDTKRFEGECLILPGNGVNVGEVFYYAGEFDAYQRTYVISDIQINSKYLFYHMKCFWKQRNLNKQYGSATNYLKIGNFNDYEVSFPPIPEQKRIVALLDTVFSDLEQTRAKTEQNLKNTRELFDGYLQQVFSQKGEGWEDKRLDEICTFSSGGTPSKKNSDYWNGDIPWVSGRDMKKTQLSDTFLHISQSAVDEGSARIAPTGTLLTLVRGMGLAHGAQVAELMVPSAFNQDIKGIHINPNIVSRFLVYVLRQKINSSADIISSAAHGTLKINMDALKSVVVPVPPKEQQQNIVDRLNSFIEDVGSLELIYHKKLSAIDELRKSILQKAFSGELTTTTNN